MNRIRIVILSVLLMAFAFSANAQVSYGDRAFGDGNIIDHGTVL